MLKRIRIAGFMALFNQLFSGTQRVFIFIALMLFGSSVFAQTALLTTTNAEAAINSGVAIAVTIGAAALTLLATIAAIKWIRGVL